MGRPRNPKSWTSRARKAGMSYTGYRYRHDPEWRKRKIKMIMKSYRKHRDKRIVYMNKYNKLRTNI